MSRIRLVQSAGVPMSPIASQSWATTSSGNERCCRDRGLPVVGVREIGIDPVHGVRHLQLGKLNLRRLQPVTTPAQHVPVHSGGTRVAAGGLGADCGPNPHRPDDLEIVELPPGALGATLEMVKRALDDAGVETDQQQRAVSDLSRELDGLRSRCGHDHRDVPARGKAKAAGCATEIHGVPSKQSLHSRDAYAHLSERRRVAADGTRRSAASADHELHPLWRKLLNRLDGAGEDRPVAGERVGNSREQRVRVWAGSGLHNCIIVGVETTVLCQAYRLQMARPALFAIS